MNGFVGMWLASRGLAELMVDARARDRVLPVPEPAAAAPRPCADAAPRRAIRERLVAAFPAAPCPAGAEQCTCRP